MKNSMCDWFSAYFDIKCDILLQAVVIDEVDSFLFRPHLGLRAKYHAVSLCIHILFHLPSIVMDNYELHPALKCWLFLSLPSYG